MYQDAFVCHLTLGSVEQTNYYRGPPFSFRTYERDHWSHYPPYPGSVPFMMPYRIRYTFDQFHRDALIKNIFVIIVIFTTTIGADIMGGTVALN